MIRRKTAFIIVGIAAAAVGAKPASAGPITFVNDYKGFLAAAEDVQMIDFETLPDGSPPVFGIENPITPAFNYTDQGVTFSSFAPSLFINGAPTTGYSLYASTYPDTGGKTGSSLTWSRPLGPSEYSSLVRQNYLLTMLTMICSRPYSAGEAAAVVFWE